MSEFPTEVRDIGIKISRNTLEVYRIKTEIRLVSQRYKFNTRKKFEIRGRNSPDETGESSN